jgi:[ribosomal protein S5]-alanine N-acetyltransferase
MFKTAAFLRHTMDYFLTSTRLGFRCWSEGDSPLSNQLWGDSEVTRLIGGPFTPEMVRARLLGEIAQMQEHGVQYWPIFLLGGDRFVGCTGLRPHRLEQKVYELGFHLCRAFWGRGLASEAARATIDYAFQTLDAAALVAGHHPANGPSRRLLRKLGFAYTGDELYPPTGLLHPSYRLAKRGR